MPVNVAELEARLSLNIENFQAALGRVDNLVSGSVSGLGRMAAAFAGAQLGVESLGAAFRAIEDAVIGFNSTVERATLSFTYLMGGADAARAHLRDLIAMAEGSPFPVEQYLEASRALQGMGLNAAFVPSVLTQIRDAAAGMNIPLNSAAESIGRFMSMIARGETGTGGLGMMGRSLVSQGLISGPMLQELAAMQQAGASVQQVLDKFLDSLGKFQGASQAAGETWSGVMVRIKDSLMLTAAEGFQPLFTRLEQLQRAFLEAFDTKAVIAELQALSTLGVSVFDKIAAAAQKVGAAIDWIGRTLGRLDELLGKVPPGTFTAPPGAAPATPGAATAPGAGAVPTRPPGTMFAVTPPTQQMTQALEQAVRLYADLNPLITESEQKSLQLAKAYDELVRQAGPYADLVRKIRDQALALNLQFEIEKEQLAAITKFQMQQFATVVQRTMPEVGIEQRGAIQLRGIGDSQTLGALEQAQERVKVLTDVVNAMTEVMGKNSAEVAAWQTRLSEARESLQGLSTLGLTAAANAQTMAAADEAAALAERNLRMASEDLEGRLAALNYQATIMATGWDLTGAKLQEIQQTLMAAATGAIPMTTAAIDELTATLKGLQRIQELKSIVSDVFSGLNRAVSTSITGIIQGTTTAKQAFENMGQSILLSIEELVIKRAFKAMEDAFFTMLDNMAKAASENSIWQTLFGAVSRAFSGAGAGAAGGGIGYGAASTPPAGPYPYAEGGLVTKPTLALIGERGPEAVVPLSNLGMVGGGGGGEGFAVVNVYNYGSNEVETRQGTTTDGRRQLEILIHEIVKKGVQGGQYDRAFQGTFGLNRQGVRR